MVIQFGQQFQLGKSVTGVTRSIVKEWRIPVSDDGFGIDKVEVKTVNAAFSQVDCIIQEAWITSDLK